MQIVALVTCHNRKDLTVRCLEAFYSQVFPASPPDLAAVVVDDGSSDGTSEAVSAVSGRTHLISGDGTLFWARGMQLAERHGRAKRPEYLLWLNDDVVLMPNALSGLLDVARQCADAVVVGALLDPESGVVTYSGVTLSRWHPLRSSLIEPGHGPREADTFNGNVVLVPRAVYESVGPIDGGFAHRQADFDYGLRARRAGFRVVVAPEPVGYCGHNSGTSADTTLSLSRRWKLMQSPKGLPLRSQARYLRRHGGPFWPLFWIAPYAKLTLSALATAPRRMRSRE